MHVSLIGLGHMGMAMGPNLVAAGHAVAAWNRSPIDAGKLGGVRVLASPAEAFQADAVLTMLSDDAAIRATILDSSALQGARAKLVHVVMSTISVAFAEELTARHTEAGVAYVSAPVLGRPDVAAKGELNVLAAGPQDAIERVRPLLDILSKKVWDLGEEPPRANAAKIACNMMITMAIEAMAEAVVLTEANGLPRQTFFDLILGTLFGSRSYEVYSRQIREGTYVPGFKASLGLKDLRLASEAAEVAGRQLPMLDAVRGQMTRAVEAGFGERDWSIMADVTIRGGA